MFKRLQHGSSAVGLLTATAIFVGLLIYANQFAFNKNDNSIISSFLNKTSDPVVTQSVDAETSVDTSTIQPSSQGIFDTPTLTQENEDEVVSTREIIALDKDNSETTLVTESHVQQSSPKPGLMPVNYSTGQWNGDQAAVYGYSTHNGRFNNNQQYLVNSRAYGRGNGRGKMNGDGDFNFSMKFKSRARMDANTDFDSDLASYGNTYQQHLYNLNAASNPYYGYNYYRY
jgi:surface antigen